MNAQRLLIGVATTALGWMVGLWAYKQFMSGGTSAVVDTTSTPAPSAPTAADASKAAATFSADGYDYDGY